MADTDEDFRYEMDKVIQALDLQLHQEDMVPPRFIILGKVHEEISFFRLCDVFGFGIHYLYFYRLIKERTDGLHH